jgi:transcriptional regulator with GAF, ATPase, and Fis domain
VLEATSGRVYGRDGAASILGLKPSTLQHRMKKLGIRRESGWRRLDAEA